MLTYLITCFALVSLTFLAMKVLPGDPFGNDQALPTEILTQLQHHYGLDRPLWTQYVDCLGSVLCWNFGYSYKFKYLTVNQILMEGFPISALLGLQAFFLSLSLGLLLGLLFGVKQKQTGMILLTVGISIPSFILATGLQYL
ncbi:MAG: ABC transporter permease, partial [Chlamydiia bacterium]|nr:ABC transporter permease [Chlamydiia bacterium]